MPQDDFMNARKQTGHSIGASELAESAVSTLSRRQGTNPSGTRQFVLDHMFRAICSRSSFDAGELMEQLRGYRLSVDAVIDLYVPVVARLLGDMWKRDEIDFATVTVGSMRLQSLLSIASAESLDFIRPVDNALCMLLVVPAGEDHTLGAHVLAAQLRRLGARVDMSFCESQSDLVSRFLCDTTDAVLFTASCRRTLENIARIVQGFSRVADDLPPMVVGGCLRETDEEAREMSGVDVVTRDAKDVMTLASELRKSTGRVRV